MTPRAKVYVGAALVALGFAIGLLAMATGEQRAMAAEPASEG